MSEEEFQVLTPLALKAKIDAGEKLLLLDVREREELSLSQIPVVDGVTSLHIPMGQIPTRSMELCDPPGEVVVYCHHGVRSLAVARWLASRGVVAVSHLDGGIDAWSTQIDSSVPRY